MANVQLPSFNTTPTDIDNAGMGDLKKIVKSLLNSTIQLTEELTYLLNNLDTRNVNELNAEVITANSITSDKIQANSITANHIQANAVTADKIDVNELSAISARLGHIISGLIESVEIYGSYIATRRGGYPKSEMSSDENMFGAFQSPSNFVKIYTPLSELTPVIMFSALGRNSYLFHDSAANNVTLTSNDVDINISSNYAIELFSSIVKIISWSSLVNNSTGRSLQQELSSLQSSFNGKATRGMSTSMSGAANCGIPIGTRLATAGGGYVTWTGVPDHSHIQN